MKAYKCDRCGKLFEEDDNTMWIECENRGLLRIENSSGWLDLCPDCKESFKKWFEEETS